jgi:NAD-dependent SIR2 family protein deacetylase
MRSKGATAYGKVELGDAKPTYAHYALMELMRKDVLKFITSTNLDGLHRKTGVPANKISEQHGNWYANINIFRF